MPDLVCFSYPPQSPIYTHTDSCMTIQGTMEGSPYQSVHKATQFPTREFVSLLNSPSSFVTPPMSIHIHHMSLQPAAAYDHNLENRTETPITLSGYQAQWQQLRGVCPRKSEVGFSYHYMHNSQSQPEKTNSGPSIATINARVHTHGCCHYRQQ